jgi:hypothetical protein
MSDVVERQHAGFVWIDIARRAADALRKDDNSRAAMLYDLMDKLEALYPDAVKIEQDLWK